MIFNDAIKNERAQVFADKIDATNATLNLLTSSGELLVSLSFAQPCTIDVSNGILTFASLTEKMVLLTAEAFKAEIVGDDDTVLADLTVSDNDGNGDLKLPSLMLFQGSILRLTNWQIKEL